MKLKNKINTRLTDSQRTCLHNPLQQTNRPARLMLLLSPVLSSKRSHPSVFFFISSLSEAGASRTCLILNTCKSYIYLYNQFLSPLLARPTFLVRFHLSTCTAYSKIYSETLIKTCVPINGNTAIFPGSSDSKTKYRCVFSIG